MKKLQSLFIALIVTLSASIAVFAWTNPPSDPPSGSGALYYSGTNVGIGTSDPGASKLKVAGTVESSSGGFKFPDATTQTTAYLGGSQTINAANVSAATFGANTGGGIYDFPSYIKADTVDTKTTGDPLELNYSVSGPVKICASYACGTVSAWFGTDGRVGIGTASPGYRLEITPGLTTTISSDYFSGAEVLGRTGAGTATIGNTYLPPYSMIGGTFVSSKLGDNYDNFGIFGYAEGTGNSVMTAGGIFGAYQESGSNVAGIYIRGVNGSGNTYGIYQAGGNYNYFAGYIGIGRSDPSYLLDIYTSAPNYGIRIKSSASRGSPIIALDRGSEGKDNAGITLYTDGSFNWYAGLAYNSGGTTNQFIFNPTDTTLNNSKMVILPGGQVGIGTTAPSSKLSVGGGGSSSYAIYGSGANGIYGNSSDGSGYGVYGSSGSSYGVYGTSNNAGVYGYSSTGGIGVYGKSIGSGGAGVIGVGDIGVQASGVTGGYFSGSSVGIYTNSCTGCSVLAEMAPVAETPDNGDIMCTNPENGKTEICKEDKSDYIKGIAQKYAESILRMGCSKTLDKNGENSMAIGIMDVDAWQKNSECKGWYPIALSGLSEQTNVVCKSPKGKTLGYGDILVTSDIPGRLRPLDKDEDVKSYQIAGKADSICSPDKETDSIKVWVQ